MRRYMLWGIGCLVWLSVSGNAARAQSPALVADYRFQNTLDSEVQPAPALNTVGTTTFAAETVDNTTRQVLQFTQGSGLLLTPTTDIVANNSYSIVVLFRFSEVDDYRKIVDFLNRSSDTGLYNLDGNLNFYNEVTGSGTPIAANTYVQVVITRNTVTGSDVTGYVDGVEQISFSDDSNDAVIDANNTLRFFLDDSQTSGEESSGAVARIRLYDGALTAGEVAALDLLSGPLPGDITEDGSIDILDVVVFVRMLIGQMPAPDPGTDAFFLADANGDDVLNVPDVIHMVNTLLGLPNDPLKKPVAVNPVLAGLGEALPLADGKVAVPVIVDTDTPLAGAQVTVTFDPTRLMPGTPRFAGHTDALSIAHHTSDGTLRLVVYSPTGLPLPHDGLPLVYLPFTVRNVGGTAPSLTLTDVVLSNPQAHLIPIMFDTKTVTLASMTAPTAFALEAAYPNPFNPSTTIVYQIPQQTPISLVVYNMLGQEVVRLADGVQASGRYRAIWDGTNAQGQAVAGGVYVYRLNTGAGFTATGRMTLLK